MNGLGNQFLAGAAFALDQHRGAAGRNLPNQVKDAEHDLALAYDVFKVVALPEGAFQLLVLFFGAAARDGGTHVGQKLLVVPRFLDEVGGPVLHGADGVVHGAIRGDHDYRQLRVAVAYVGQNLQSIVVGQGEIKQDQVEGTL